MPWNSGFTPLNFIAVHYPSGYNQPLDSAELVQNGPDVQIQAGFSKCPMLSNTTTGWAKVGTQFRKLATAFSPRSASGIGISSRGKFPAHIDDADVGSSPQKPAFTATWRANQHNHPAVSPKE